VADDEWEVDVVVDLDTWDELLTALLRRGATHLLYRGQRDFDWQLACKLSRSLRAQAEAGGPIPLGLMESMVVDDGLNRHVERVETSLLRSFMEAAQGFGVPDLPPAADRLGWWEVMQHHRAPTRLMDWTRSPFVALWFALAFEDADPDVDAALWIFDSRNSWINHGETRAAVETQGWEGFLDYRAWQNRLAEEAMVKNRMVPLVVTPRRTLPRAVAQQSVMTLIPNVQVPSGPALK
jgi:hypothetical protein